MKCVSQTILHDPENGKIGNCLQACIASILELNIDEVPHFAMRRRADWFDTMNTWLIDNFDVQIMCIQAKSNMPTEHGYCIVNGYSSRGILHSVVALDTKIVHDPHPSQEGLITEENYFIFVSPMNSK